MVNEFKSDHEQSNWIEPILTEYRNLLKWGNLDTASCPFITELKRIELSEYEKKKLRIVGMKILLRKRNGGIGYLSSSSEHRRDKELKATLYITQCFREKDNPVQPIVVSIDEFYRFIPGNSSLVGKTQIFNEIAEKQNIEQDFALILSDFSGSNIFTQEILEQVPTQNNAGLDIREQTPFGNNLLEFATNQLPLLIKETKGDLNAVLRKIVGTEDWQEDAKLLLVTGLLLQDRQTWQNLWYERKEKGTPLYIVAPMNFHDAMNRLNLSWGHGVIDYRYRASCSLGDKDEPPLEDEIELKNYHEQGLSLEEFKRRIEPILNQFKK